MGRAFPANWWPSNSRSPDNSSDAHAPLHAARGQPDVWLYATHYFHTALDLSVCVDDGAGASSRGFYLLTLKGSQQEGLTGVKGSILRKVVVDRTRSSLEGALASIKRTVEESAPRR